jgi:hypothetical protein
MIPSVLVSRPREELVKIIYSSWISVVVGVCGLVFFLAYSYCEDRKEEANIQNENTIVYGTKETYVTIQHQFLCHDNEEFLRHVQALSKSDLSKSEFLDILANFKKFLKIHRHNNFLDVAMAHRYIEDLDSAYQWILVAQAFWILHPWKTMIPYVPLEMYASDGAEAAAEAAADAAVEAAAEAIEEAAEAAKATKANAECVLTSSLPQT